MKIAVIDIGTNSIHMLIAELHPHGGFEVIGREKEMARLGDKTLASGRLSEEVMRRGLQAIVKFDHLARSKGVRKVLAVATSAVREAKNGEQFIRRIQKATGIQARVITGEEEGRLIYLGVKNSVELKPGNTLLVDIGGGSVEIMVVNRRRILFLASLKMGVARLKDLFLKGGSAKELRALERHVAGLVDEIAPKIRKLGFDRAIGTSGTLNNLASMAYWQRKKLSRGIFRDGILTLRDLKKIDRQLRKSTPQERLQIKGLDAKRGDLIVGGAASALVLMEKLGVSAFHLCDKAIREGMIYDYIERHDAKRGLVSRIPGVRLRSVVGLARRCDYAKAHAEQVSRLALQLFEGLKPLHDLDETDRELLHYSALLHDIGYHIGYENHHRHAQYLIQNAELTGFSEEEVRVMSLAVRYHRGPLSKKNQVDLQELSRALRRRIEWLAAILRLADALDRSHFSLVKSVAVRLQSRHIYLKIVSQGNASYEIEEGQVKCDWVEKISRRRMRLG